MTPPLPTPSLVVDLDVLEENVAAMARHARDLEVALRPHAKTHKSPELAGLQVDAGAAGLTVATVSEARVFADAGFTDLFIAYPLWVDPEKGRRLRALAEDVSLAVGVDSAEGARTLAAQLGTDRSRVRVLVEVDSGQHRSGVAPEAVRDLVDVARHAGLHVSGVFTFPGHGYSPGAQDAVVAQEASVLAVAAASLRVLGIDAPVVSGGATPTVGAVTRGSLTEIRPGVYVFGDAQQWELGTTSPERIALTCWATVVSHAGGRVVLDAGSKALGADRAAWATGFGRLLDRPEARIVQLSEHHAVVEGLAGPPPALGSHLRVVPNHVCTAVNLADTLTVVRSGRVVASWPVAARGATT